MSLKVYGGSGRVNNLDDGDGLHDVSNKGVLGVVVMHDIGDGILSVMESW